MSERTRIEIIEFVKADIRQGIFGSWTGRTKQTPEIIKAYTEGDASLEVEFEYEGRLYHGRGMILNLEPGTPGDVFIKGMSAPEEVKS